jgi:hypothetical protein
MSFFDMLCLIFLIIYQADLFLFMQGIHHNMYAHNSACLHVSMYFMMIQVVPRVISLESSMAASACPQVCH